MRLARFGLTHDDARAKRIRGPVMAGLDRPDSLNVSDDRAFWGNVLSPFPYIGERAERNEHGGEKKRGRLHSQLLA